MTEQATVVIDLKNRLAELRNDIANNPTPDVSEDEIPAPTLVVPPPAPPAGGLSEKHSDLAGDGMDADVLEEMNPLVAKRRGEFGAIDVPSTKKEDFQQWTAGLDRESVRQALSHLSSLE